MYRSFGISHFFDPWVVEPRNGPQKNTGVYGINMGVSKNSGTPKSSILIGFSIINHPFWGTTIFGNTYNTPPKKKAISEDSSSNDFFCWQQKAGDGYCKRSFLSAQCDFFFPRRGRIRTMEQANNQNKKRKTTKKITWCNGKQRVYI